MKYLALCLLTLVVVIASRSLFNSVFVGSLERDGDAVTEKDEGGDVEAKNNLEVMYDDGEGVSEDDKEAVKWYRKSADQGHLLVMWN